MNTSTVRGLIVTAMVLQVLWFVILPAGNQLSPRSPEMAQVLRAYETNRAPAASNLMWDQVRLDDLRDSHRKAALFSLMLLADAAAIYFFWNLGAKKNAR